MKIAVPIIAILMVNAMNMKVEGTFTDDAIPPNLICFSKNIMEGKYISTVTNVRDLALHSEEGANYTARMHSCSVTGIWILYEFTEFEGNFNAIYGFGSSFIPSVYGNVSSIRKVESNHKYSSELVLFEKPLFQEIKLCNFLRGVKLPISCRSPRSAIVKGFSDWTLFTEVQNPLGPGVFPISVCLKANSFGAAFFPTLDSKTVGVVTSIKQGCKGKVIRGKDQILHKDCRCNPKGVVNGDIGCNENGDCKCKVEEHYLGRKCDKCEGKFYMKDWVCTACRCNPSQAKECNKYGHCYCKDPTYSGKRCNVKKIHIARLRPRIQKNLWVICHGFCGRVSLTFKVSNNLRGQLKIESGVGWFRCDGLIDKHKHCQGNVRARSFPIRLLKLRSPADIDIAIMANNLDEVK